MLPHECFVAAAHPAPAALATWAPLNGTAACYAYPGLNLRPLVACQMLLNRNTIAWAACMEIVAPRTTVACWMNTTDNVDTAGCMGWGTAMRLPSGGRVPLWPLANMLWCQMTGNGPYQLTPTEEWATGKVEHHPLY